MPDREGREGPSVVRLDAREELGEESKGSAFAYVVSEFESEADLVVRRFGEELLRGRTYLTRGIRVMAQMMAEIPPITSSSDGASPLEGQIPFKTYSGEVPRCQRLSYLALNSSKRSEDWTHRYQSR